MNNKEDYHQISKDQTAANNETVNNVIERFQKENIITKNVAEGLKTTSSRTPRFYIQPKIHKQGNPGRLVISFVNHRTSNISKYVDSHLQPIVQQIPSYIQDTSDFLGKIDKIENCKNNLQIKVCAMGTTCALGYANIFMDQFERKYIYPFLEELLLTTFLNDLYTKHNSLS